MAEKKKRSKKKDWLEGLKPEAFYKLINSDKLYGYREFCRILGIPIAPSGSTSQIRQLDMINMLCEYEKENSKFRFVRMRDERDIELFRCNTSYSYLIKCALAQTLLTSNYADKLVDGALFLTMPKMMEICGMVNENFNIARNANEYKRHIIALSHPDDFGKFFNNYTNLNYFIETAYGIIKSIMREALKSMDNERSLTIQRGYILYKSNDNGGTSVKRVLSFSPDGEEIERICGDVLTEMKIKRMNDLYYCDKKTSQRFYNRCNELCRERLEYDGFYNCYAMQVNERRMEYMLKTDYCKALNYRTQDRLYKAKQFDELGEKFKHNLITAMISLTTTYDFDQDYKSATKERAGN